MRFAKSLVKCGVGERKSVNLIGFNAPEWAIAFFGTMFANCIPTGVYTTNTVEACLYQAEHSEAEVIVVENGDYLDRYITMLSKNKLQGVKVLVVYNDDAGKLRTQH